MNAETKALVAAQLAAATIEPSSMDGAQNIAARRFYDTCIALDAVAEAYRGNPSLAWLFSAERVSPRGVGMS